MSTDLSKNIIAAAIEVKNYTLASKVCIQLAKKSKHDGALWEAAGELSFQAGNHRYAAACYAYGARAFAVQKKIPQAIVLMKNYAEIHKTDEGDACRHIFQACRGQADHTICSHRNCQPDNTCQMLQNDKFRQILPNKSLSTLLQSAKIDDYAKGEYVAREGRMASSMYIVSKGQLQPLITIGGEEKSLPYINTGEVCAEMPYFLSSSSRIYSIIATEESEVLEIPYTVLKPLCQQDKKLYQWLHESFEKHLLENQLISTPFFECLEFNTIQDIAKQTIAKSFNANEVIFHQGDTDNLGLFLLKDGRISLTYEWQGKEHYLCSLQAGDVFGELGLLNSVRKITAYSISESHLMYWPEKSYKLAYGKCFSLRDHAIKSMRHYQEAMDTLNRCHKDARQPSVWIDRATLLDGMHYKTQDAPLLRRESFNN